MSDFSYIEWRKKENIRTFIIPDKEKIYWDLLNIEHSFSGRMDGNICNTFIMEAEQLLVNSIELFELGYFDCAYYSLRTAIDISTTMVFLVDINNDEKEQYLKRWKTKFDDFPQRLQMIKKLTKEGDIFSDMYENMPTFFKNAENTSQKLNKYVHKQGLNNFYVSRNHPFNQNNDQSNFISDYISYLNSVIGIVAVMRLAIDPFPILLMDEEILYRCFDSLTEPYTNDFVQKYIGQEILEEYKKTSFYITTRSSFESEEKKSQVVFDITKHQYIDTTKFNEISEQFHLMTKDDIISTIIACSCDKIVKVYSIGGLQMYFTNRKTNRTKMSYSGLDFHNFKNAEKPYNQQYDEVYISVFKTDKEVYFAEHNEKLNTNEIALLETKIKLMQ